MSTLRSAEDERRHTFRSFCAAAQLSKAFYLRCIFNKIDTCLLLVSWNYEHLTVNAVTLASATAFFTHINYTPDASDGSKLGVLVNLAKQQHSYCWVRQCDDS